MGDYIDRDRFLVAGQCSVCGTLVIHTNTHDGVQLRFIPHDDPEWCRGAAALHVKALARALEQAREDVAVIGERERYWRRAYDLALRELEGLSSTEKPPFRGDYNEWAGHIEQRVRDERQRDRERQAIGVAEHIKANKRGPL